VHLGHQSKDTQLALKKYMTRKEKSLVKLDLAKVWKESGLSQIEFARTNNIKLVTLQYWIRKLRKASEEEPSFIQLSGFSSCGISIRYPNGVELTLPVQTPASVVKSLINY
jgi:DNA-binding transcriptional regulator YiaG